MDRHRGTSVPLRPCQRVPAGRHPRSGSALQRGRARCHHALHQADRLVRAPPGDPLHAVSGPLDPWTGIAEPDPANAELVLESHAVVWLPAPDRVNVEEAIDTILHERYGIAPAARVPGWAQAYPLPAEATIASEIASIEREREDVEQRLSAAKRRVAEAALPRQLLYESGENALEPIVRDTLRSLGARVEDPEAKGTEDGKLFRDGGQAVLEIKGRDGPIKLADVRQVVQWAAEATAKDGIEYKALILGNPDCHKPLDDRGEVLAPNAAAYALISGVGVVKTTQLFAALRQKQEGAFNEAEFWKTAFKTNGVAKLDEPTPGNA